jgi:hypothetical protein
MVIFFSRPLSSPLSLLRPFEEKKGRGRRREKKERGEGRGERREERMDEDERGENGGEGGRSSTPLPSGAPHSLLIPFHRGSRTRSREPRHGRKKTKGRKKTHGLDFH